MKKKLLNALRVRLEYRGYKFGPVSNPFDDRFCIAVKNPDGKSRVVFIDENETDYDMIAQVLDSDKDATEITKLPPVPGSEDD